jgi:hypothetical protein
MRVAERGSPQVRPEASTGGGFAETLRRARQAEGAAPGGGRRVDARGAAAPARKAADAGEPAPVEGRGPAPHHPAAPDASPDPHATPALAALARALPVAVAAAAREGAPLALSFGRSLDVELRTSAGGVELLLRPEPRLERAAQAELPRLVAALRARGVAVARAAIRPGGAARPSR